ncbi:purine nucleoside phosphorylase-like [Trichogramma pretiosum]|uniref:purine nucleoside phosphorylase-like n=1 Tax=Trichogramma pretiosum TaxID=7493 RepID=UPI0006C9DB67|nr:purine nucleoside phosphorylase-like [Trichogramma pretiosum]
MPMVDKKNGHNNISAANKRPSDNDFLHTVVKQQQQQQQQAPNAVQSNFCWDALHESAQYMLERTSIRPRVAIICGSGLGSVAEALTQRQCFPYEEIPHFPTSMVKGHANQMVFGYLQGMPVMCMQGRYHHYEGYPIWKCSMPVRVMKLVGVTHLIVTNAAGGINPDYNVGDIMLIKDHINFMGFAGINPLQGPNDDRFGDRFPMMHKAYDRDLLRVCDKVVDEMGMSQIVRKGVYTCLGGPNFETVAEMRALKMLGVDAVGMSTVYEVITAVHCGIKCLGFSLITNIGATDYEDESEASHDDVVQVANRMKGTLKEFVSRIVAHVKEELDGKSDDEAK